MEGYVLDWVNLLLRWAHVITAIAWIGASFYFVLLDSSLTRPQDEDLQRKGVDGELWAVHGGGFYHSNKYLVAPGWRPLPDNLHWSYWESYSTWLTGFALFTVLYLFNAGSFLIDPKVFQWPSELVAVVTALGFLIEFWLVYDVICRLLGARRHGDLMVGIAVLVQIVVFTWLVCHLFAGRAAFLLMGAMLATAMSANVFFWIIPGQRKVVAQLRAGEAPDPVHGQRAKQRSVHNTYFTLPVIMAMLSNHYGWLYQAPANWLVLIVLMLGGALIRHSFVSRHKAHVAGRRTPWEHAVAGVVLMIGLGVALAPAAPDAQTLAASKAAATQPIVPSEVRAIVDQRCGICHNATVHQKGIDLHTGALLKAHAQAVFQQAAVLKLMPLGNATQMTEIERGLIRRWYESGAPVD